MNHPNQASKTVTLFSQPFLDTYNQCYKNIVTVNLLPQGPLAQLVRRVQFPPLSQFKQRLFWFYDSRRSPKSNVFFTVKWVLY